MKLLKGIGLTLASLGAAAIGGAFVYTVQYFFGAAGLIPVALFAVAALFLMIYKDL